jgi:putative OPT family oligopeptide transporter
MIGSSNNPISGITLATVLTAAVCLQPMLGANESMVGPAAALLVGCIISCAAALSSDNMQDLKCGYILGSTPWKQQLAQLLGCVIPAFLLAPIITLLNNAYGIGVPSTHEHPTPLAAPQARLLADVARGVFTHKLPWTMVGIGMFLAFLVVVLDTLVLGKFIGTKRFRIPVLALATGLYLPFELSVPILTGGIMALIGEHVAAWRVKNIRNNEVTINADVSEASGLELVQNPVSSEKDKRAALDRMGLLFAAGLITGESMVGIIMAIPIVIARDTQVLAIFGKNIDYLHWMAPLLCTIIIILFFLIRIGVIIPKKWWQM